MGTDIHGIFQKKVDNRWEDVETKFKFNRHYLLFAWLGNVRNGFGFASVRTHTPIESLSDCRGYPKDFEVANDTHYVDNIKLLPEYLQEYEKETKDRYDTWMGDHSHSWVTSEEMLKNISDIILTRTGIIPIENFKQWDGKSQPDTWSGGISGRDIEVQVPPDITPTTTHVRIFWEIHLQDEILYFIDEVKRLVELHGEIRFVFGFDS